MSDETIPQMRETIESLQKQLKAEQKALAETQARARKAEARELARSVELDPAHGELFAASNPDADLTEDAFRAFADQFKLAPAAAPSTSDEGEEDESSVADEGLAGFTGGGSRPGAGGQPSARTEKMTRDEWNDLNRRDPQAARVALHEGRVQLREDNPWLQS